MMRGLVGALLLAAALGPAVATGGPLFADATLDEYFRLEWQATTGVRGPTIAGHVENRGPVPVERVQLMVERLDAGGAVVESSRIWLPGAVPVRTRAYFSTPVTTASAYRVRILAFDWMNCRD